MASQPPSSANLMLEEQYDFLDLPGSLQLYHQQTTGVAQDVQETGQLSSDFAHNETEMRDGSGTVDALTNNEGNIEQNEIDYCDNRFPWARVKWTEKMIMTLITILSYVGEETQCSGSWKERLLHLRKIGKWRCISRVMVEKGYNVSPQQCEDKFNSLSKTYKRLNELLGRGISCNVVENPKLLGAMDISAKAKEKVKRILASKHLFFEQMCCYHNGNRVFLPHDPDVLQSLLSVLGNEGTCIAQVSNQISEVKGGLNVPNDTTEASAGSLLEFAEVPGEWMKQIEEHEVADPGNPSTGNRRFHGQAQSRQTNFSPAHPETKRLVAASQFDLSDLDLSPDGENNAIEFGMEAKLLQLEEQKLLMKTKMLKLHVKWRELEKTNLEENLELEKMRLENKRLKLANEYGELELQQKIMNSKYSSL